MLYVIVSSSCMTCLGNKHVSSNRKQRTWKHVSCQKTSEASFRHVYVFLSLVDSQTVMSCTFFRKIYRSEQCCCNLKIEKIQVFSLPPIDLTVKCLSFPCHILTTKSSRCQIIFFSNSIQIWSKKLSCPQTLLNWFEYFIHDEIHWRIKFPLTVLVTWLTDN